MTQLRKEGVAQAGATMQEPTAIGLTSLLDAHCRAHEKMLFYDAFAEVLAGNSGAEAGRVQSASDGGMYRDTVAPLRVNFVDGFLRRALANDDDESGGGGAAITQVVVLGAGLDTRPLRLAELCDAADDRGGIQIFEVDFPAVLDYKNRVLASNTGVPYPEFVMSMAPGVVLNQVSVDWANEKFDEKLRAADGFSATAPTAWVIEGVLSYLSEQEVRDTLTACAALCAEAQGSRICFDVMSKQLAHMSRTGAVAQEGSGAARFDFGTDEPERLLSDCGWAGKARVLDLGSPEVNVDGRYKYPECDRASRATMPAFFLVEGQRHAEEGCD